MKKFASVLILILLSVNAVFPCGPGYVTPVFDYKHAPENPFANFAAGKIGILKPTYRRVVLLAAYRYLNNGTFSAGEQQALVDVRNAEFNNKEFRDDEVNEAVKAWVEKRKDVVGKEEKTPEIYTERTYGGYDFFPNCTQSAFETATQTLSDRITAHGSDNKDVKDWVTGQDKVFMNCASGKSAPEPPNAAMAEWLQKDRAYQIAAAEFYSLNYEKAKNDFKAVAEDSNSPWQETADYLVGRTLIRQASLTKADAKAKLLYEEAERHLQVTAAKSGKYSESADRLLGLIKYRLHPQARVGELARNLSFAGTHNFRQDLIDYTWLLDKFEKESLEAEEKRKEELKPKGSNTNSNGEVNSNTNSNTVAETKDKEGLLAIYIYGDDYSQNWTVYVEPEATDEEAIAEAEKVVGRPLTEKMKELVKTNRKTAYTGRFSQDRKSEYQGGYYGEEKTSLSLLPDFLRQDDLTDWPFTFQIQNAEAYLYSLSKFKQTNTDLWLMTALSKADSRSSELKFLLDTASITSPTSPAYPTIAYHTARILIEQNKTNEARKLLDEILASSEDLPISSRNRFLEQRLKLAETFEDFLKFAQRKPFAFDWDGSQSGSIDEFIAEQKSWYSPESYAPQTREEYEREVEESFKEERLWQDRTMFDDKTVEIINQHFPLTVLMQAQKSPALPDYLQRRFALAVWTRAVLLEDLTTAEKIAPEVVKYAPETADLMTKFLAAKTPQAKSRAALYLILKSENLTPYISAGMGTPGESYSSYASRWWCSPYELNYDPETGEERPYQRPKRPIFLTPTQSDAAQTELKKLKEVGDAPAFLANKVLEWAKTAPVTDERVPESLYIVYEANGWDKYGCGNNEELYMEIGDMLKKRYPQSEWGRKVFEEEGQSN